MRCPDCGTQLTTETETVRVGSAYDDATIEMVWLECHDCGTQLTPEHDDAAYYNHCEVWS